MIMSVMLTSCILIHLQILYKPHYFVNNNRLKEEQNTCLCGVFLNFINKASLYELIRYYRVVTL